MPSVSYFRTDWPVTVVTTAAGLVAELFDSTEGLTFTPEQVEAWVDGSPPVALRAQAGARPGRGRRAGHRGSVWEPLATEFGIEFVSGLLRSLQAGDAVLTARRRLLAKRNPLGLAYTLYARSDLHLTL